MGMLFFAVVLGYALLISALVPTIRAGVALLCALLGLLAAAYGLVILCGFYAVAAYGLMYGGLAALVGAAGYLLLARRRALVAFFASPAVTVYLVLAIAAVYVLRNATPWEFDSYSFWARAPKELYTFDRFYISAAVDMPHADYNPIFAALQYALARAFGWAERYLFYVPMGCLIVCICALADGFKRHARLLSFVLVGLFLMLYCATSITYAIAYLGTDGPLGVLFGTLAVLWFTREGDTPGALLPHLLGLLVLPALKLYAGVLFAIVLWVPLALHFIRGRGQGQPTQPGGRRWAVYPAIGLALILCMHGSWSAFYHYQTALADARRQAEQTAYAAGEDTAAAAAATHVDFTPSMLWQGNPRNASLGTVSATDVQTAVSLTKQSLYTLMRDPLPGVPVSFLGLMLLYLAMGTVCAAYMRPASKRAFLRVMALLGCGSLVYAAGTFAAYLVQPATATSVLRYLGVCANAIALALLYFAAEAVARQTQGAVATLCAVAAALVLSGNPAYLYQTYIFQSAMAYDGAVYAQSMIDTRLQPALAGVDSSQRILLIDGAYDNVFTSGVVNAYQYLLLPRRAQVLLLSPGEDSQTVSAQWLADQCRLGRIDQIVLLGEPANENISKVANLLGQSPTGTGAWVVDASDFLATVGGD